MPTYLDPVQGVTFSEAYADSMVHADASFAMLTLVELLHPDLTAPIRAALNTADVTATLESTAPEDPSTAVLFTAVQFGHQQPTESDDATAAVGGFWMDGVSALLAPEIEPAAKSLQPVQMIVRVYASNDLSAPACLPPLVLELRDVRVTETRVTATAGYGDFSNRRFPGKTFTRFEHPSLAHL